MTAAILEPPPVFAVRGAAATAPPTRVLYVLKRYPRLSETFVVRELIGVEANGVFVGIDALLEPEAGTHHAEVDQVRAVVRYLPRRPSWTASIVAAHLRVAVRRPLPWLQCAVRAHRSGTWRRFVAAGLTADRVRRERFQHVHAHFATGAAEVARDAAALSGVTYSVTAHAKDIFHADNAAALPARLRGAAVVATVSHYNVRHLQRLLPDSTVRYVPNGLPLPTPEAAEADGPILCVARLVPKKGVDVLLRAAALMTHDRSIEIVGDGPCRADLETLAAELGLVDRVRFHGALTSDSVDQAYRRCALVVLPCRIDAQGDRDGMPTVLIEAMARGLPVVSSDIVGIGELITPGRTGMLVPPDEPGDLARVLDGLLDDPLTAQLLGDRGRHRVVAEFAPAHATAALLRAFAEAVER